MKFSRLIILLLLALTFPRTLVPGATLPSVKTKVGFPSLKLTRPLWLCEVPDDTKRLFVAQQDGKILILPKDRQGKETKKFLDISDRKPWVQNEEGLLGFAFHPDYKSNGKFYIYYSQQNPRRSVISEFTVSTSNPDEANKSSERILLEISQPESNHNGGELVFGPDGFLYVGLGDGGGANDQFHSGQNLSTLLAKILRLDVNSKSGDLQYGIPKDNPFVGTGEARSETWAYGLRNPWRFSFDKKTGELYCADVGQNKWEEIDVIEKGGNYGWSFREGLHEFGTRQPPAGTKFIDPILDYPHNAQIGTNHLPGLSITGGYVYRGEKIPALQGVYLYTDFVSGTLWGLLYENKKVTAAGVLELQPQGVPPRQFASFGEDGAGEIYILGYDGNIYELEEPK
ncbi:MAG: PQQ-dependent sugar dehydrogenase [Verrucomicrobiota bacterium]